MAQPVCAYDCIELITAEDPCDLNTKCLCTSTTYLNKFHDCINFYCDAAGIAAWVAYGDSNCAAVGVSFSITATLAPGAVSTIAATGTAIGFPHAATVTASTSVGGVQPVTSTAPASAQTTQNSTGGLGIGAVVGIVIGGVALVLLAILAAFLIWRKRRKQPKKVQPETTPAPVVQANIPRPDMEKEFNPVATTSVVYSPQYSAGQAIDPAKYDAMPFVSNVTGDARYYSQQFNPAQAEPLHHVSPLSTNAELARMAPSEVASSTRVPSSYGLSYPGAVEADSTRPSYITSVVSEVGSNPSEWRQELSASNYVTSYSPATGYSNTAAQELPSFPAATPMIPPTDHASTGIREVGPRTDGAEAGDLDRMKIEIEAVRAEKERVLHLQALEDRERELSKQIVNRELAKGSGS